MIPDNRKQFNKVTLKKPGYHSSNLQTCKNESAEYNFTNFINEGKKKNEPLESDYDHQLTERVTKKKEIKSETKAVKNENATITISQHTQSIKIDTSKPRVRGPRVIVNKKHKMLTTNNNISIASINSNQMQHSLIENGNRLKLSSLVTNSEYKINT